MDERLNESDGAGTLLDRACPCHRRPLRPGRTRNEWTCAVSGDLFEAVCVAEGCPERPWALTGHVLSGLCRKHLREIQGARP